MWAKAFILKLTDSESEAGETQSWLDFSLSCGYMTTDDHLELYEAYNQIIGKLVNMSLHPDNWSW